MLAALAGAPAVDANPAAASRPASAPQNSRQPAEVPLDFDPARPERVDGWWFNGGELLRLEPNGAYRMWLTPDRFAAPTEVGAWRRSNYVLFDLEPYRAKPGTRIRVQLAKHEDQTCIERPGMRPFHRVAQPPRVFGDDVLGAWTADREQLLVLDNGRYEYRRLGGAPGISQHDGIWRTDGRALLLAPDSTAVAPIRLEGEPDPEGGILLRGSGGVFRAVRPESSDVSGAAPATPAPVTPGPASAPASVNPRGTTAPGSAPPPAAQNGPTPTPGRPNAPPPPGAPPAGPPPKPAPPATPPTDPPPAPPSGPPPSPGPTPPSADTP
jgi:hypothetical protein